MPQLPEHARFVIIGAGIESIFSDWQAKNITSVLHERRGGFTNNQASLRGLATKARAAGVRIHTVRVTDLIGDGGAVAVVQTDGGTVRCDTLVVAGGPWVRDFWSMLRLPETVSVVGRDGQTYERPMWTYWSLQEGAPSASIRPS